MPPPHDTALSEQELDSVLSAIGDFADLKSPSTAGHSRAVATLAAAAAREYGLNTTQIAVLRRAGVLAGAHRERLDGSGYPQGRRGAELEPSQRILATADAYQTYLEPRPHRPALSVPQAAQRLRVEARGGRLEEQSVQAVLAAAGLRQPRRRSSPSGLTGRELEVLRLLCQGMNNKDIAGALFIAPKTARNHVEHIYEKIGAGNRVSATLFALDNGLWDRSGS